MCTSRSTARAVALCAAALAVLLAGSAAAIAKGKAPRLWPPADQPGKLFVHFGEEHVTDPDGGRLLPKVVRTSARFRPDLVTMSGDKASDGTEDELRPWADVMAIYDRKEIPWFAGVGNHDRTVPPGVPDGSFPLASLNFYTKFFADRPYPMGDRRGYRIRSISPRIRPAGDPAGASSHYYVDAGPVRWIFIDNSCFSILLCDLLQNPSAQNAGGEPQYDFLARVGAEATKQGRLAFVVMHMPTQDPRDQLTADPISLQHTMGKGPLGTIDNALFEQTAEEAGVDGVFVGHIKGQWLYKGRGGIPYFIDGGAGGGLYTTGPVGVDHGYWHGFRVIQARRSGLRTDAVPIFARKGIRISGPKRLSAGSRHTFEAFGRQPVVNYEHKVPALELRDPNPTPRFDARRGSVLPAPLLWFGPPALILALIALRGGVTPRRRRMAVPVLAALGALAVTGLSIAQEGEPMSSPTSTPVDALPNPARIWTSANPRVLTPVASESDDPRRTRHTQTADGTFRARCPGHARLTITSGSVRASQRVTVTGSSRPGCKSG